MLNVRSDNNKRTVEMEVIRALRSKEYTLNTVNNYGENLLHISAANGCSEIIREILKKPEACEIIDRKNKFGWTPLMLAVRNRDINTVKILLENGANVNEWTYFGFFKSMVSNLVAKSESDVDMVFIGMSVFGLAAAINKEMFDIVYKACPSALLNAAGDDITPLCVAAMKNDKELFFRLMDLGVDVSNANDYAQLMMKRSTVPEIANLAKQHLDIEDYWNDMSDNISIQEDPNEKEENKDFSKLGSENTVTKDLQSTECVQHKSDNEEKSNNNSFQKLPNPPTFKFDFNGSPIDSREINKQKRLKPSKLYLLPECTSAQQSLISPSLSCNIDKVFPLSPNVCFLQKEYTSKNNVNVQNEMETMSPIENEIIMSYSHINKGILDTPPIPLQRLQSIRPSDLDIHSSPDDLNVTLGYTPEFSPIRSPHVPPDINDENVFGENTPTPPRYKTPPRGIILNSEEVKMFILLKRYGLSHYAPVFLKEEVDVELFMTLTDQDLIEIGIKSKLDRNAILTAIMDFKKSEA